MRRCLIFLMVLLLIVAGFALTAIWMFNTTEGARWIMGVISRFTPIEIGDEKVAGQLGKKLQMEQVHVRWPQGEMIVDYFQIHWHPLHLLTGKTTVEEMTLQGVQIQDDRPEIKSAPDLELPTAPGLFLWVSVEVKNLHVTEFLYRRKSRDPLKVEKLNASLNWSYGLLTIENIDLELPSGIINGIAELGLTRPSLYVNINLSPSKAMGGVDNINLNSRLLPAKSPEQLAGNVVIEGRSGSIKRFLMETEIRISKNALHLRNLVLSRFERQEHFTGNGRIVFTADDIKMSLGMKFSDLDLSQELVIRTAFSGSFNIKGNPNDYKGDIRIENTKGKWYSGYLSGAFKGGLQEVRMSILSGSMLDGNFQGNLNVRWGKELSLTGSLQARNLNPAIITPDWDGKINLDLEGTFRWPKENPPEGRLSAHLLKSYLRGQQLTGNMELHNEKSTLRIAGADLKGKGFNLFAKGVLQERLTFNVDVSDLSGLIPGTRGSFFTNGWIRWRNQRLALYLNGQGKALFIKDVKLGSVDLSTRFDEEEGAPVELKGKFLKVVYKSFRIDSLTLEATGELSNHKITISAHSPEGKLKSTFEGRYSKERWRGMITHLSGSDVIGEWKLQAPAEIDVSSSQIKVNSLRINSNRGENLQFDTDLTLHPLCGTLHGEWHQLNLARANPWLGRPHVTGHSTGNLSIQWLEQDRLRITGMINLAGTFTDERLKIELSQGLVRLNWSEKGLLTLWEFEDARSGRIWGSLSSPQPGRMIIPDRGRLEARWEGIDLGHLQPFLPPNDDARGTTPGTTFRTVVR
ncbi:MAG: hypothetical protein ACUVT6_00490 [Thermodesulfobacteriota bacterium]